MERCERELLKSEKKGKILSESGNLGIFGKRIFKVLLTLARKSPGEKKAYIGDIVKI